MHTLSRFVGLVAALALTLVAKAQLVTPPTIDWVNVPSSASVGQTVNVGVGAHANFSDNSDGNDWNAGSMPTIARVMVDLWRPGAGSPERIYEWLPTWQSPAEIWTSFTPNSGGTYRIDVQLMDGRPWYSGVQSYNIVVANPVPAISSPLSVNVRQGYVTSYQITATNSPTSFTASPLPAGLSFNASTGVISGRVTAGTSTVATAITATNAVGTDTKTLTWNITGAAITPSASVSPSAITYGSSVTLTRGGTVNFQPIAWIENVIWKPDGTAQTLGNLQPGSQSYTPPAAGNYSYQIRVVDDSAYNYADQWVNFTVAKAAQPAVSVSPASSTVTIGQSVTFTASGGSGTGAYVWGGAASGTGTTQTVTFGAAGTSSVTVYRAGDGNYNDSAPAAAAVTVSGLAQTVTLAPGNLTNIAGQPITFTASGGQNGYVWGGSASGSGSTKTLTFASAGTYSVSVYSPAGGSYAQSNTAASTISVIVLAPNASVSASSLTWGQSVNLIRAGTASRGIAWTESTIWPPSGAAEVQGNNYGANALGTSSYTPDRGLGTYSWQFRLVDNDQNFQEQSIAFTVTAAPTSFAIPAPNLPYTGSAQSPVITSTPSGATFSASGTSTATAVGTYSVTATANGNYTGSSNLTWSIVKADQAPVTVTPANPTIIVGQSVTFSAAGGTGTGGYVWGGSASGSGATKTVTFNTAGTFTATVSRSGDNNYNDSNAASATIVVTPPPIPAINSPLTVNVNQNQPINYQISATNNPASFNATGLPSGLSVNATTGVVSGQISPGGTYSSSVIATNSYGSGSANVTWNVTPAQIVPAGVVTGGPFEYGKPVSLVRAGTANFGVAFTESVVWTPAGQPEVQGNNYAPNALGTTSYTPLQLGTYTWQLRVVDSYNNFQDQGITFTVDRATTTFSVPSNSVVYTGSAQGPVLQVTPSGATYGVTGTTSATEVGNYAFTATATGNYTGSQVINWSIVRAAQPSVSISPASASINPGDAVTFSASGGLTGYTWGGSASGTGSTQTVTFPNAGTYTVTVFAPADSHYDQSNTATTTVTVAPPVPAPTITSLPTANATLNAEFNYQIVATQSPTSYGATGLPAGLSVNYGTGLISGAPTQAGTFNVGLSATNAGGTGTASLTLTVSAVPPVPVSDYTLVPPITEGVTHFGAITGFGMYSGVGPSVSNPPDNAPYIQPLFQPYDRDNPEWWDNLLDEALFARLHIFLFLNRGGPDVNHGGSGGYGNNDPIELQKFIGAAQRRNAFGLIHAACFIDTAAVRDYTPGGVALDLSNTANRDFMWTCFVKRFYDQFTQSWDLIYQYAPPGLGNPRPMIMIWRNPSFFTNEGTQSNGHTYAYILMTELADKFQQAYSVRPVFFLDNAWRTTAADLATHPDVIGFNTWIDPHQGKSFTSFAAANNAYPGWGTQYWTAMVPGFRNHGPGGTPDVIDRAHGQTLLNGLSDSYIKAADLAVLEGFANWEEDAAYYRSLDSRYDYPNQYLNLVRQYADRRTETLCFQAEGCDAFAPQTPPATPAVFRTDGLDVVTITNMRAQPGWAVRLTAAGAYVEYKNVSLAAGHYRFTASAAAQSGQVDLQLVIDGQAMPAVAAPGSLQSYDVVSLGETYLTQGQHTLRVISNTGAVNLDWFFSKKTDPHIGLLASNGLYVSADFGGGGGLVANRPTQGTWETFTLIDINRGTLENNDQVYLQTNNGHYVGLQNGVRSEATSPGSAETFQVIKLNNGGTGSVTDGDSIALRTSANSYVTIDGDGLLGTTTSQPTQGATGAFIIRD